MTYGIVLQVPETPITEDWFWITDIGVAYDGTEDSVPLLRYPRRMFNGQFRFDDAADLRRHLAMATKRFKSEFDFPLWQYQSKLKAAVAAGADTVTVNARRGDFRVGGAAIIVEGDTYEQVEIAAVTETELQFADVLANDYSARAIVCPVSTVYTNTNAQVTRSNPDYVATASFTFLERVPTTPLVSPLNEAVVATFDDLPLLPYVPIGTSFEGTVDTGLQPVEYTGLIDLVSPWTYEQWAYQLTFNANRIGNVDDCEWWQAFADEIQGSAYPFLFPTNRADFEIVTPAIGGGTTITVEGDEYSQHYSGHGGFSRIFIDTDAGRHYAKITGLASVGGNDQLVFSPALPVGAGWTTNQKLGFLLKVRVDNDKVSFKHYGLTTEVSISIRTVV
jgi:hypothetical protein